MESPLLDKSLEFASQVVLFYEEFSKSKKDTTIAKQLLRSATSIGANINEAVYGNSKADFIAKSYEQKLSLLRDFLAGKEVSLYQEKKKPAGAT